MWLRYGVIEEDYIMNAPAKHSRPHVACSLLSNEHRLLPQTGSIIKYTIKRLPPDNEVIVQVRVLNKYYAGPPSNQIIFKTKEGGKSFNFLVH